MQLGVPFVPSSNSTIISLTNAYAFGTYSQTLFSNAMPCQTNNSINYSIFNIEFDISLLPDFNTSVLINDRSSLPILVSCCG